MYTICTPAFFVRNNSVSVLCGSYKKRKSMKTKITLLLLCLSSISYTQNPQWLNQEHIKDRDTFRKSVFVNSSSGGVVVNFLQQQTEQQEGGSNIPDRRFLFAYGENGNALWSFETNQINIFDLLVKEEGAFWLVGFETGEVHIGNQTITSPQPYPQNRSLYFIEINSSGVVVDYFVYTLSFDIFPLLADVVFDQNGDFVILATIHPDQILPIPFEFGNFNTTLDPDERLHIVAKMDTEGNFGEIFTYTSPRLDRKSTRLNSSHVRISYAVFCLKKKIYSEELTNLDVYEYANNQVNIKDRAHKIIPDLHYLHLSQMLHPITSSIM